MFLRVRHFQPRQLRGNGPESTASKQEGGGVLCALNVALCPFNSPGDHACPWFCVERGGIPNSLGDKGFKGSEHFLTLCLGLVELSGRALA
jgi:hypothetical protein